MFLLGFPGGLVVKHPPANARDTGSIPDLARSTCCRALSLSATTTEPRHSTAHALQQEASTVRRLHTTTREQPPPLAAAREKPTQQRHSIRRLTLQGQRCFSVSGSGILPQQRIEFPGPLFHNEVNDRPDDQVAKYENACKHKYGDGARFQPVIDQVCGQVADIQNNQNLINLSQNLINLIT